MQGEKKVQFYILFRKVFYATNCDLLREKKKVSVLDEIAKFVKEVRFRVSNRVSQDGLHESTQVWDTDSGIGLPPEPPSTSGRLSLGRRANLQIRRPHRPETHHPRQHHGKEKFQFSIFVFHSFLLQMSSSQSSS